MREPVRELTGRPDLVLSDHAAIETVEWAEKLIDQFERPARVDEVAALVELLSRCDESSCHGLNWAIIHFIETSPNWPDWNVLAKFDGEWIDTLKQRLANAGLYPPPDVH